MHCPICGPLFCGTCNHGNGEAEYIKLTSEKVDNMSKETKTSISISDMCKKHQSLLVRQTGYGPDSPWQALVMAAQVALFQAASCDKRCHEEMGGDIKNISKLGCLACRKPDSFGEIVTACRSGDIGEVKALGESWVRNAQSTS